MMEFYCGLYLAKYARDECVELARPFANDEQWSWAWRFAIELPCDAKKPAERVSDPAVLCRSLAALYAWPDNGTRPTELMFRAWDVLEQVPGGQAVRDAFHAQFREKVKAEGAEGEVARQLLPDGKRKRPRLKKGKPEFIDNFILCPPGEFWMGSPGEAASEDERPRHRVQISKAFWLQSTPVTRAQYRLFDPHHEKANEDDFNSRAPEEDCPVIDVSWYDAWVFAQWVGGCLPTEAEWEYACRAGTQTRYFFGDDPRELGQYAWVDENSESRTHPVVQKTPNAWGLFDMLGNVSEWCADWYGDYADSPVRDPEGPLSASGRVFRGGSWYYSAATCRSADRDWGSPSFRSFILGFRLAAVQS
jgi:formylglycine-generating enzyme required for sulfatase activity